MLTLKITNKLYQPIPLIIDKGTIRVDKKSSTTITCKEITEQLRNLEQKGFIKIEKVS